MAFISAGMGTAHTHSQRTQEASVIAPPGPPATDLCVLPRNLGPCQVLSPVLVPCHLPPLHLTSLPYTTSYHPHSHSLLRSGTYKGCFSVVCPLTALPYQPAGTPRLLLLAPCRSHGQSSPIGSAEVCFPGFLPCISTVSSARGFSRSFPGRG
jgi:hypothetical protein